MSLLHTFNLNRLTVFVAVIDTGSITAASARLGMSKTMVSTHLQRLEADLGVTLLNRTTRQVSLTEAGRAFYDAGRDVLRRAEDAISAAQDGDTIRGILRVSTPTDFGTTVLAPMLVDFREQFPELHVELVSNERRPDLIGDNIDVAIHFGALPDSTYRAAILAGGGIAFLPRCSIADHVAERRLVRVLPNWASPVDTIYAVMPPSRYRGEKIRTFLELVKEKTDANLVRICALPTHEAVAA